MTGRFARGVNTPANGVHHTNQDMYFGQPLRRREDERFLLGRGNYVDDITLPEMATAVFVRSPHAHALIRGISTGRAAAMPGVSAVLTARDWEAAELGELV